MPAGKGTYGNKVGRPSNKRTGEDFLDREEKKKKPKKQKKSWKDKKQKENHRDKKNSWSNYRL